MYRHCVLLFVAAFFLGISGRLTGIRRLAPATSFCPRLKLTNGETTLISNTRWTTAFRCNPGFHLHGTVAVLCTTSGEWQKEPPICVAEGCPDVRTSLTTNLKVKQLLYRGSLVNFECDQNLTMVGSETIFCNGQEWNDTVPMCYASACPEVLASRPINLRIRDIQNNGTLISFTCDDNFTMSGSEKIFCNGSDWSGTVPVCYQTPTSANTIDSCNFEKGLCGWSHNSLGDIDRARDSAKIRFGPSVDHTSGNRTGHFLYIAAKTLVVSQNFPARWSGSCFQFWYKMYGGDSINDDSMSGSLEVHVAKASGSLSGLSQSFHFQGNQPHSWQLGQIEVPTITTDFQIVMNASRGTSPNGIAIDDVTLFRCSKGGATFSVQTTDKSLTFQTITTPPTSQQTVHCMEGTRTSDLMETQRSLNGTGGEHIGTTNVTKETQSKESKTELFSTIVSCGAVFCLFIIVGITYMCFKSRKRKRNNEEAVVDENVELNPSSPLNPTAVEVPNCATSLL